MDAVWHMAHYAYAWDSLVVSSKPSRALRSLVRIRNSTNWLQHATVSVWLYEQLSIRIEGKIRVSNQLRLYGNFF